MRGRVTWSRAIRILVFALLSVGMVGVVPNTQSAAGAKRSHSFRMFALGYKQTMEAATSYESFRQSLESRFEQIDDLFVANRPNVVILPEDTALTAWLIGPRGTQSRLEGNTAVSAIASLGASYAPQVSYYEARCNVPPGRALVLALTDTTWRAFGETLGELAKKYGVYIFANANIAIPRRVEGGVASLLADPSESPDYAYEASTCDAYNAAFVFAPDGEMFDPDGTLMVGTPEAQVRGLVPKAYLVPIERDQTAGLALSSASPTAVRPVDLGFASFGFFTSKDAWMSDLPNRNDIDGADIFVQPEAGPWAGWNDTGVKDWQQDAMRRALWGFVQKLPSFRYGALSNLLGNFHDLPFDGTPTITSDAHLFPFDTKGPINQRHYLLGRPIEDGIVARSEWVVADPGPKIPFVDIGRRREFLQAEGDKLAPGSGVPEENDYLSSIFVWADVTVPADPPPTLRLAGVFDPSVALASTEAAQWEPSLAAAGESMVAAWTDLRTGDEDILISRFDGTGWTDPFNAGPATRVPEDQTDNQYGASVAITPTGTVHVVFVDFRNQSWDVRATKASASSLEFEPSLRVDHSASSAEGYPHENLHNDPVVAVAGSTAVAAWDDLRSRAPDRDVRTASLTSNEWDGDGSPLAPDKGEQFHPALSVAGERVWLAWQDQSSRSPRILASLSYDSSALSFGRPIRVSDGSGAAFHPQIATSGRSVVAVWSDDRSGRYQIRAASGGERGFSPSIELGSGRGDQTYPALVAAGKKRWIAAWTDARAGDKDVALVAIRLVRGRLVTGDAVRVDDSGAADARMPALTVSKERIWVAWEDMRTGVEQIRVTSAPLSLFF